jgi:hypothetical protein
MIRNRSQAKLHLFLKAIENQLETNDAQVLLQQCRKIFIDEPDFYEMLEPILTQTNKA